MRLRQLVREIAPVLVELHQRKIGILLNMSHLDFVISFWRRQGGPRWMVSEQLDDSYDIFFRYVQVFGLLIPLSEVVISLVSLASLGLHDCFESRAG